MGLNIRIVQMLTAFTVFLFSYSADACVPGHKHDNPMKHRPYVGTGCVYYGEFGGYIVDGPYKGYVISDEMLPGFAQIKSVRPDLAFSEWLILASLGNQGAQYNVGTMLHKGNGTEPDWIAALDFLRQTKEGLSHYNTADSYETRILQQALIGLGFLQGRADGEYGPKTDRAVGKAIAMIDKRGPRPDDEYWHIYMIVDEYRQHGGWRSENPNLPTLQETFPSSQEQPDSKPQIQPIHPTDTVVSRRRISAIPISRERANGSVPPAELYRLRGKSVHMIFAAKSLRDLQSFDDVLQGSAVAVTDRLLVTNCHVVGDRKIVIFIEKGVPYEAERVSGSDGKDACIIRSKSKLLKPIDKTRKADDMAVGEVLYAIGSPRSQENTLSQGLLSGIRRIDGVTYLQTTAPISPGSSGGGLFDASGNLVGITTMAIEDSQALNFAIAIDEFR